MNAAQHYLHHEILSLEKEVRLLVEAWKRDAPLAPCHIIVPHITGLHLWKRILQEHLKFYFNLEVWTPDQLYLYLVRKQNPLAPVSLKADDWSFLIHLHLERALPALDPKALKQSAHNLNKAFFLLLRAGHDPQVLERIVPDEWRSAFRQWMEFFKDKAEFASAYQERLLLTCGDASPFCDHHLLVLGFDSSHWSYFPLLTAALRAYGKAAIFTFLPSDVDRESQRYWMNWCESVASQDAVLLSKKVEVPRFEVVLDQDGSTSKTSLKTEFLFAINMRALAERACLWARDRLADGCKRIAIVLPNESRLAGVLTHELRLHGIPFYSEFSTSLPLRFDQQILEAWLRLQLDGMQIPAFLGFWKLIYTVPTWQALFDSQIPTASALEERLEKLWSEVGENHLDVLQWSMDPVKDAVMIKCVKAWETSWRWPDSAPLGEYAQRLLSQIDLLIGENIGRDIRRSLRRELSTLSKLVPGEVSKWLAIDRFKSFLLRAPEIEQKPVWPFIHILSAQSAQGLAWDAILCVELHEGVWPGSARANGWLSRELVCCLNAEVNHLDRFIIGHGDDLFALELEHFGQLFNLALQRLDLGVALYDETINQSVTPSLFFTQTWEAVRGERWDRGILRRLKISVPAGSPKARSGVVLDAHVRRRQKTLPFDEYSFMLAKPGRLREYSVTECEEVLKSSDWAWYRIFLDCRPRVQDWSWEALRHLFQGSSIHRWLGIALQHGMERKGDKLCLNLDRAEEAVYQAAKADYDRMECLYAQLKRPLPHHWGSVFASFEDHALSLLALLKQLLEPFRLENIWMEKKVSSTVRCLKEHQSARLALKGKVDVVIDGMDGEGASVRLIVDYKTGREQRAVTIDQIRKLRHFQLLGYAALAYEEGRSIRVMLLNRNKRPELIAVDPFNPEFERVWSRLGEKLLEGRWGYDPDFEEWDLDRMPLAHVPIAREILKAKYAMTFEDQSGQDNGGLLVEEAGVG